ncbi:hypothetical protein GCM10010919_19200 [Alishewanella longhuensis]|uniref:Uncharacterized protein n=1 Tax=Alishewanella longhuensis TaxID=1091037 RepID=A0ABQ3KYG9_9ALTE|nr:hypothetical protein [Alishewanella longhuensis]GHG69333.1 hypothetical protein GCM10010919_19200 [Alishewanella longhuensis]
MHQQLFLQQLAQLPVAPVPFIDSQQCQGFKVIIAGEQADVTPAARFLAAGGATILELVTDLALGGRIPPKLAMLLEDDRRYDALVLVSRAELSLLEKFKQYRNKLYLYRSATARPEQVNLNLLSDEVSRRVMSQQFYLLQHNCYLEGFSEEAGAQYFHPIVHAVAGEKILCIGPYLGKPFQAFSSTSGGDFTAHCLEANPFTYAELCINLVSWGMQTKVRPVCAGAWSGTGMVAFASEGHTGGGNVLALDSGRVVKPGEIDMAIFTYAVDDYVRESGFVPSLLESGRIGIATEVVKGAKDTIIRHRPKMILLDYPDTEAIALIKQWVPDYKVYYSECGRESYGVFFLSV